MNLLRRRERRGYGGGCFANMSASSWPSFASPCSPTDYRRFGSPIRSTRPRSSASSASRRRRQRPRSVSRSSIRPDASSCASRAWPWMSWRVRASRHRRREGEANMSKRILVVEDQEDNRQIVRDLLMANDYEMTEAENGEEALAVVAKNRPDLILMDIQLPIMDGYEATRRIKADPSLSSIPIIAVTSYALSGDEEKARAAGCDDFVPKPYSPRQLLAKIREFLR